MLSRLAAILACTVLLAGAAAGCGGSDVEDTRERLAQARQDLEQRARQARAEYEQRRERFGRRIRKILAGLEQVVPRAERTSPVVRSRGRNEPTTIDAFLTEVPSTPTGRGRSKPAACPSPRSATSGSRPARWC